MLLKNLTNVDIKNLTILVGFLNKFEPLILRILANEAKWLKFKNVFDDETDGYNI